MKKRYIVKYDHHRDRYGVYDIAERAITWLGDQPLAASTAARCNAVEALNAHLGGALSAIGTIRTAALTWRRRNAYTDMANHIRTLRADLPDVATLAAELAQEGIAA